MRTLAFIALLAVAGCFDPSFQEGIRCGPEGQCPSGLTCGADDRCGSATDADAATNLPDASADARWLPDAQPDAMPVACTGDPDCQTPPNGCLLPGTCNLETGVCAFGAVDCSSMDGECTQGICDTDTGACVAVPASEGNDCGAVLTCDGFGACAYENGTCDSTGSQSRTCTSYSCQLGTCTASAPFTDTATCTRPTNGTACGSPTQSNCGACDYGGSTCANSGSQTCNTCVTPTCQSDVCVDVTTTCSRTCTRNTNGTSCGSSVDGCQGCDWDTACGTTGDEACTCSAYACSGGSCVVSSQSTCTFACNRAVPVGEFCGCAACGPDGELSVDRCCSSSGNCTSGCGTLCGNGQCEGI